jgi:hypothetical protein
MCFLAIPGIRDVATVFLSISPHRSRSMWRNTQKKNLKVRLKCIGKKYRRLGEDYSI